MDLQSCSQNRPPLTVRDHFHVTTTPTCAGASQALRAVSLPKEHKAALNEPRMKRNQSNAPRFRERWGSATTSFVNCQREEPLTGATPGCGLMLPVSARDDPFVDLHAAVITLSKDQKAIKRRRLLRTARLLIFAQKVA